MQSRPIRRKVAFFSCPAHIYRYSSHAIAAYYSFAEKAERWPFLALPSLSVRWTVDMDRINLVKINLKHVLLTTETTAGCW
jgi:hypothetical protein